MKLQRQFFMAMVLGMMLAACQSLGTAQPQTFNQKVAYAIGVHTAILQATTTAVTNGGMSSADASAVLSQADNAKTIIDGAVALSNAGDLNGANSRLSIALTALMALQTYLNSHGGK